MIRKRLAILLVLISIIFLLSGCGWGPKSETIVIPGTEDEHLADSGSKPFKVKTIYRLPVTDTAQLLGWMDSESVVGLFREGIVTTRDMPDSLQRLAPPYKQVEKMQNMDNDLGYLKLSPNGKYIIGFKKARDGIVVKLISLSNGSENNIATLVPSEEQLLTKLEWSDNSRYISYLVATDTDTAQGRSSKTETKYPPVKLAVYDTMAGQIKHYLLKGRQFTYSVSGAKISDDGQSVLINCGPSELNTSIAMGTIDGTSVEIQYEHQMDSEQMTWMNKDQFVFLGTEGVLYEYDRRNKALTVLLERVLSFQLSQDRKYIAYSQKDNDSVSIFAGKLQGNNVLYKESVYQGVSPAEMYWSLQNNSLLVIGRKMYSATKQSVKSAPIPDSSNQPFIIKFQ
ncbi:LPS-assembly lipoprotein LptE [Paenibacillus tuaregi]|uniref:hypothetical protein n=1 Tax=Paenibacillus tuaregi TaxID=1816681 RepID=UPI0008385A32|nr:hypothetical protein [Paenibacillus tuaregi]